MILTGSFFNFLSFTISDDENTSGLRAGIIAGSVAVVAMVTVGIICHRKKWKQGQRRTVLPKRFARVFMLYFADINIFSYHIGKVSTMSVSTSSLPTFDVCI